MPNFFDILASYSNIILANMYPYTQNVTDRWHSVYPRKFTLNQTMIVLSLCMSPVDGYFNAFYSYFDFFRLKMCHIHVHTEFHVGVQYLQYNNAHLCWHATEAAILNEQIHATLNKQYRNRSTLAQCFNIHVYQICKKVCVGRSISKHLCVGNVHSCQSQWSKIIEFWDIINKLASHERLFKT